MTDVAWHLEKNVAFLRGGALSARVDLLRPADGMHQVATASAALADARLLGIEMPSFTSGAPDLVVEKHVRGTDLVVAYHQTEAWPVCVDALWRAATPLEAERAVVDLLVSVATQQLDSRPEMTVRTAMVADEVLRLADAGASRFSPLALGTPLVLGPGQGPGCLLFRWRDAELSYAEMVHPADFGRDELAVEPTGARGSLPAPVGGAGAETLFELRHRLFPHALEKGVILRARLRGVFCARAHDAAIAAAAYRELAAADPPLSV